MCVSSVGQVSWEATVRGSGGGGFGLGHGRRSAPPWLGSTEADSASSWHQPPMGAALTVTDFNLMEKVPKQREKKICQQPPMGVLLLPGLTDFNQHVYFCIFVYIFVYLVYFCADRSAFHKAKYIFKHQICHAKFSFFKSNDRCQIVQF